MPACAATLVNATTGAVVLFERSEMVVASLRSRTVSAPEGRSRYRAKGTSSTIVTSAPSESRLSRVNGMSKLSVPIT